MVREFFPYHFENKKKHEITFALRAHDLMLRNRRCQVSSLEILAKILGEPNLSILITSE